MVSQPADRKLARAKTDRYHDQTCRPSGRKCHQSSKEAGFSSIDSSSPMKRTSCSLLMRLRSFSTCVNCCLRTDSAMTFDVGKSPDGAQTQQQR